MTGSFEHSVTPHQLLLFGFPYVFGGASHGPSSAPWTGGDLYQEVGNYLGITILALAVVGVFVLRKNRVVQALGVMAVVARAHRVGPIDPVRPSRVRRRSRGEAVPLVGSNALAREPRGGDARGCRRS